MESMKSEIRKDLEELVKAYSRLIEIFEEKLLRMQLNRLWLISKASRDDNKITGSIRILRPIKHFKRRPS